MIANKQPLQMPLQYDSLGSGKIFAFNMSMLRKSKGNFTEAAWGRLRVPIK
jgi:hypothetical protein